MPAIAPTNCLLVHFPGSVRESLLADACFVRLPVGHTFARAGDPILGAFFPDSGVIVSMSQMSTGHQMAVTATGSEGMIGLGPMLGLARYPNRMVVLVESVGFRVPPEPWIRAFEESAPLRRLALKYVGRKVNELTAEVACSRVHSHRQRLARWLLVIADKSGQLSLPLTHELVAQMVGGPRHAVTVALSELRTKGAITQLRGRIEIVNRSVLAGQTCECYKGDAQGEAPSRNGGLTGYTAVLTLKSNDDKVGVPF
jgi:CRP-like cAMP-binding protein